MVSNVYHFKEIFNLTSNALSLTLYLIHYAAAEDCDRTGHFHVLLRASCHFILTYCYSSHRSSQCLSAPAPANQFFICAMYVG